MGEDIQQTWFHQYANRPMDWQKSKGTINKYTTATLGWVQCGTIITQSVFSQAFTKTPRSSPVRASYEVSFVDPASDWYSTSVLLIVYVISYIIRPCFNSVQPYMFYFTEAKWRYLCRCINIMKDYITFMLHRIVPLLSPLNLHSQL